MKKTNLLLFTALFIVLHAVSFKSNAQWSLNGNSVNSTNYIGTTNNSSLRFRVNNQPRMILDTLGRLGIGTAFPTDVMDAFDGTNHTLIGGNQIRFTRT